MLVIRKVLPSEKEIINDVVNVHMNTFTGFFLTFMGPGFLKQMYTSYCEEKESGLLVAINDGKTVGFLAYSGDFSALYKYMIKKRLVPFGWFATGAFFRNPKAFMRIIRAFLKPGESKREEKYTELASIGVDPSYKSKGVGSKLIDSLKDLVDFDKYEYITLETDAINNDIAIAFYEKNGFVKNRTYSTHEGRKMVEYRYSK